MKIVPDQNAGKAQAGSTLDSWLIAEGIFVEYTLEAEQAVITYQRKTKRPAKIFANKSDEEQL